MKKYLLSVILILLSCHTSFASENLVIIKRDKKTITFNSIEVEQGSIKSQINIVRPNINSIFTNVIGFANIAGNYGQYKKQLPITASTGNTSHYYTISIAYSKQDKSIICIQECWNNSSETYEFPELDFNLEWYLIKNKSF